MRRGERGIAQGGGPGRGRGTWGVKPMEAEVVRGELISGERDVKGAPSLPRAVAGCGNAESACLQG